MAGKKLTNFRTSLLFYPAYLASEGDPAYPI